MGWTPQLMTSWHQNNKYKTCIYLKGSPLKFLFSNTLAIILFIFKPTKVTASVKLAQYVFVSPVHCSIIHTASCVVNLMQIPIHKIMIYYNSIIVCKAIKHTWRFSPLLQTPCIVMHVFLWRETQLPVFLSSFFQQQCQTSLKHLS